MDPTPANRPRLDARATARVPEIMDEASTHSSLLRGERRDGSSTWLYYQKPVQNYLRGLGCRDQDIEDITHDVLIRLETHILLNYNPSRPFRPYFKTAVRNFYFSHLRARNGAGGVDAAQLPDPPGTGAGEDGDELSGLLEYAEQAYDHFAAEADGAIATGIAMLQSWILEGAKQEHLARTWKLTDRQVRTHLAHAADALAAWLSRRINPADLEQLMQAADRSGAAAPVLDVRSIFTHLSKTKRRRTLMLLAYIYQQKLSHPPTRVAESGEQESLPLTTTPPTPPL